jgi:antitoxin ParD1/3/4
MNVSLTTALEKFIQKKVASKQYQTASEVVRQALRLMQSEEEYDKARLVALRQDIQVGIDQGERGEYLEIRNEQDKQALLEQIGRQGRARLAAKQKRRSA